MRRLGAAGVTAAFLGVLVTSAFVILPLVGGPPVIRAGPILLATAIILILTARPWTWSDERWTRVADWNPSNRMVWLTAVSCGLLLFWFVLTRFKSGSINAIDFTVYYERPIFQTLLGKPLYVESADDAARAYRSLLAVHSHWVMLPLAALYLVSATPLWVLALSVAAVVAGAAYTLRIVQSQGGGGLLGSASAFAFILNDNTARTLNYGFHAEVLYAWFVPWMIHAGLLRRWKSFAAATAACIAVKEDAFLLVFGVAAVIVLVSGRTLRRVEWMYVAVPIGLAVLHLLLYYRFVVPRLSATGTPFYASYWANYGPTAVTAAIGMLRRPVQVLLSTVTSGFTTKVIVPHLYFPLAGWRWCIGIAPVVVLYGASANEQLRSFGIYYAIVLVPFLVLGAAAGAQRCVSLVITEPGRARAVAAALVVFGALIAGISNAGYSLRPWKPEIAAVPGVLSAIGQNDVILVQSGLYPHAGYASHVQVLTHVTLNDPRYAGAVLLLAPALSAYPLTPADSAALYGLPVATPTPPGLVAVRRVSTTK